MLSVIVSSRPCASLWANMVGGLLNESQWALPPDMPILVSPLSGYQPDPHNSIHPR